MKTNINIIVQQADKKNIIQNKLKNIVFIQLMMNIKYYCDNIG